MIEVQGFCGDWPLVIHRSSDIDDFSTNIKFSWNGTCLMLFCTVCKTAPAYLKALAHQYLCLGGWVVGTQSSLSWSLAALAYFEPTERSDCVSFSLPQQLRVTVWSLCTKSVSYIKYPKACQQGKYFC